MLEILYQDEFLVAVNKPNGLLVHRSPIAADASEFAVQILRDQLGKRVYPVHRLDRKTSGVLVFALSDEMNRSLQIQFMEREVTKQYLAFVRGFTPDELTIDYPLYTEDGVLQDAITRMTTIQHVELDLPSGKFESSRYSFVHLFPETGRMHQLRKHMAHIFHPIIGDRPHGCNKQNKLFKEQFDILEMYLHAERLSFMHPVHATKLDVIAPVTSIWKKLDEICIHLRKNA